MVQDEEEELLAKNKDGSGMKGLDSSESSSDNDMEKDDEDVLNLD